MEKSELCVMAKMGICAIKENLLKGDDPNKLLNGWINCPGTEIIDEMESILAYIHYRPDVVEAVSKEFGLQPNEAMWLALGLAYGASITERNPQLQELLFGAERWEGFPRLEDFGEVQE